MPFSSTHNSFTEIFPFDYHDLVSLERSEVEIVQATNRARTTKVFRHQNLIRKILFFLIREGPIMLWQKYASAKFSKILASQEIFLVARHSKTNTFWGGFQHSLRQPIYYFLRSAWTAEKPTQSEFEALTDYNPFLGHVVASTEPPQNGQPKAGFRPIVMTGRQRNEDGRNELYLIGCGDYARTVALPAFKSLYPKMAVDFNYETLVSKYLNRFEIRANDFAVIPAISSSDNDKVAIISSYHSYHARQAATLLAQPGFKVIVEKPPCVTIEDLRLLARSYDAKRMFIGYNRRHIRWNWIVKELMASSQQPVVANVMVTETQITKDHWYFAPMQGTRICGNLCHWVDLAVFLVGHRPLAVSAARNLKCGIDYSSFSLLFEDGSLFTFTATDLGDGTRGVQEVIHIRSEDLDVRIEDYLSMRVWHKGKTSRYRSLRRNKGHRQMYKDFAARIARGDDSPYTRNDLMFSTLAYLSMLELHSTQRDFQEINCASL